MRKQFVVFMTLICVLVFQAIIPVGAQETPVFLYVATDGSDANNGSIDSPFATLEQARDAVRKLGQPAVVNLRGGIYPVSESFLLNEQDKDTVYRAYLEEEVVLTAAQEIPSNLFKPVQDQTIKDRIVDKKARDQVVCMNLHDVNLSEYGKIFIRGMGYEAVPYPPSLFFNDQAMTLARYPSDGYLNIDQVVKEGTIVRESGAPNGEPLDTSKFEGFQIKTLDQRLSKWKEADDIWVFGYFKHDWAEATLDVTIDFQNENLISSSYPSHYGVAKNQRFYFFNLLEELDQPGEWYLDRDTGMLYLIAPEKMDSSSKIEFITFNQPFIQLKGSKNITLKGLNVQKGLGKGIAVENSKDILIADCEFSSLSDDVIVIEGGTNCGVVSNYIHDVGASGMRLTGGDRITLTPGGCYAENNLITRYARIKTTYAPGIGLYGVGNRASHNEISDSPHYAINYGGNDQIIEYNNIYNVCTDTSDSGAIYIGRNWTTRGNEIRYNYIHDLNMIDTNTGMKMQAIYLDDMSSSTKVYGNVFHKIDSVALFGGGRNNTFENNLILEAKKPFVFDNRGLTWMDSGNGTIIRNNLLEMPYKTGIWAEKYPELVNILEDNPEVPKYNVIQNNISYQVPDYQLAQEVIDFGTVANNISITKTDCFVDYKNGDFTMKEDHEIWGQLPDFKPVPFQLMRLRTQDVKNIQSNAVILQVGSPRAIAQGIKTLVDPNNVQVRPEVVNNRTLVPVRFIAASFGAQVDWEEETKTVTITKDGKQITLAIGIDEMKVNGGIVQLDVPAQTIENRTMLPLRALAEALDKKVFWDDKGLIVMSDEDGMIEKDDTFLIDALIRSVTIQ